MNTARPSLIGSVSLFALLLTQCADEAQFEQGLYSSRDAQPTSTNTPTSFALTWNLACGNDQLAPNAASLRLGPRDSDYWNHDDDGDYDDENAIDRQAQAEDKKAQGKKHLPDIRGDGTHNVPMTDDDTLSVSLRGTVCQPATQPRDIVFVIDTSQSMHQNDRYSGGTCGRAEAVASVINNIRHPEKTRIGLVTFGSSVTETTGRLLAYDQFVSSMFYQESILCESDGNTSYRAALAQSVAILSSSQPQSSREVYFISDGEPSTGQSGIEEASILKDPNGINATIATMMVDGHDSALKSIASVDSYGAPMHAKTDNAHELAEIIKDLSDSEIIDSRIRYRGIGSLYWTEENLNDFTDGVAFDVPMENIRLSDYPNGLEIEVEYIDSRTRSFIERGSLLWEAQIK